MENKTTLEDYISEPNMLLRTNVTLALLHLLENCGVEKKEVLGEKFDKQLNETRDKILDHFQTFVEKFTNKDKVD